MVVMYRYMLLLFTVLAVHAVDLNYTDITVVNDETRYLSINPDATLTAFSKVHHVKGNVVFTAGERITGDRLILTFLDQTQFTKSEDIEVLLKYPAKGVTGATLTGVEIYADLSANDADAFFVSGGIGKRNAEILLMCNQTLYFTYEIFMYGY